MQCRCLSRVQKKAVATITGKEYQSGCSDLKLEMLPERRTRLARGVVRIKTTEGITVLGAPVGYNAFVRGKLEGKVEKIRQITEKLPLLKDPHCEFVLLRSCLALPKMMFLLRALDYPTMRTSSGPLIPSPGMPFPRFLVPQSQIHSGSRPNCRLLWAD